MAATTAADKVLISTHLSDIYSPLQTTAISIQTSKTHVPLPPHPTDEEPPVEHAHYASFFHSVQTGAILLRLIHNGLIIELVSLSTETPPIRFVFPYTVLPNPALFLLDNRELHVLAVTASASLYRLVIPLQTPHQLWSSHMVSNWCREYHLKNAQDSLQAQVQVQGTHSVALALTNGSLIRIDAETIGDTTTAGPFFPFFSFPHSLCIFKITGPRICFIIIHSSRPSPPFYTKAHLMVHILSPRQATRNQPTLATSGHFLVIGPFVCGQHAAAAPPLDCSPPWPLPVESRPPARALQQTSRAFFSTPCPKSSSPSMMVHTSLFLFQHLRLRLLGGFSSCSTPRMTTYSWSSPLRHRVRARMAIYRIFRLSMVTFIPCGTAKARPQSKFLTFPCHKFPMNPKASVGASYSIPMNPT
jgi:hypothetical protein